MPDPAHGRDHPEGGLEPDDVALLSLLSRGHTTAGVASRLGCSERTVRRRLRVICDRLEVGSPIEAVVVAVRRRAI